jgi:cytochrome P450
MHPWLVWLLVAAAAALVLHAVIAPYWRYRALFRMPAAPWLPVVGSALFLKYDSWALLQQLCQWAITRDPIWLLWVGTMPTVWLTRADVAAPVLSSPTEHTEKSSEYDWLHPWLGQGLLTSHGDKWRTRRRLLTPAFHYEIIRDYVDVFVDQAAVLTRRIAETPRAADGFFDVYPLINAATLDIICESAMGVRINAQSGAAADYVAAVKDLAHLVHVRQKSPWQWWEPLYRLLPSGRRFQQCLRILHSTTERVIRERRATLASEQQLAERAAASADDKGDRRISSRKAFLDLLLTVRDEHGQPLTDADIREEVDTFQFRGHDTTSAGVSYTLLCLGAHPEVQRRAQEEVDAALGDADVPSYKDLSERRFPYLECVIKEAMRLFPPVPIIGRVASEDVQLGGYTVPKGAQLVVGIYYMQRNQADWENPNEFDPSRFEAGAHHARNPFAFVPFSAGPRNCIGQKMAFFEEQVLLAAILRKFNIESKRSVQEASMLPEIVTRPKEGIEVRMTPRSRM